MLHSLQHLTGFACEATDGPIGTVADFYLDDRTWRIRVLVVGAGVWLASRQVLIPSRTVNDLNASERRLNASLTRRQVRASPDIGAMEPVSRQHEVERYGYYGYPPEEAKSQDAFFEAQAEMHRRRGDDLDLRSFRTMQRYHVHASDGSIGHLEDMIVDDATWTVRDLVVDTSDWGLGHSVLVATDWVEDISWLDAMVTVSVDRNAVRNAPAYRPGETIDRSFEARLSERPAQAG